MSRYWSRISGNEKYAENLPDVKELGPSNPCWSKLPPGQRLTYDIDGFPNGLGPTPAPVGTAEEQARIDLEAAGVTVQTVTAANYLLGRGDNTLWLVVNAAVDAVSLSSGLTLAQVSELI